MPSLFDIEIEFGGILAGDAVQIVDRAADRAARKVVEAAATAARQTNAFKDSGKEKGESLRDSIHGEVVGTFSRGDLELVLKADADHASYVNDGTAAHVIRTKKKKALKWEGDSGTKFAKSVNHPGTKPTHFLESALDPQKAAETVADSITDTFKR